jgi:hypothetical protein
MHSKIVNKRLAALKESNSYKNTPLERRFNSLKVHEAGLVELWNTWNGREGQRHVQEAMMITAWIIECLSLEMGSLCELCCGAGLVTCLLSLTGFQVKGIDKLRRVIWDKYSTKLDLSSLDIDPSTLVVDGDWLIGVHADQLTLWIPLIAQRLKCKGFFIIPCCLYLMDGTIYSSAASNQDSFKGYLDLLQAHSVACGFALQIDELHTAQVKNVGIFATVVK